VVVVRRSMKDNLYEPGRTYYIKKNSPVAYPAAKGSFFILERLYIALEGIMAHFP
jgi:hypothetical protein